MVFNFVLAVIIVLIYSCLKAGTPIYINGVIIIRVCIISTHILNICSSWIVYRLVLVILGGLMVLFTYITRSVTSEKLFVNFNFKGLLLILLVVFTMKYQIVGVSRFLEGGMEDLELSVFYSIMGGMNLILLTCILIITMIISVKMVQVFKGSLK